MIVSTIDLDLPKHSFHVHAVDARGLVIETSALRRSEMIKFFQNRQAMPCWYVRERCSALLGSRADEARP